MSRNRYRAAVRRLERSKADASIQCWGPGGFWRNGECGETLPDGNHATMRRLDWGFTMDEIAAENYYACPEHKDQPPQR